MSKIPVSLKEIDSRRVGGCEKRRCDVTGILHRHHKRHEAMWFGVWTRRRRTETKWKEFIERYHKFLPKDCAVVCPDHHAEIHLIYDEIINEDRSRLGKPLSKYSWQQAERLMDKLEAACEEWLKKQTPGIDNEKFAKERRNANSNSKHSNVQRRVLSHRSIRDNP